MKLKQDRYTTRLVDLAKEVLDYKDFGVLHEEIADVLENIENPFKLFIIPRGHFKSSEITIAYPIQKLIQDPNDRILITSGTWKNSKLFLSELKGKVTSQNFIDTFGVWESNKWNEDQIIIKPRTQKFKEPSVMTTGAEVNITGQHYFRILADDLVGRENSSTPDQIRKIIDYFERLMPILEPGGELLVVGTPWHLLDLYAHIQKKLAALFYVYKRQIIENGSFILPEKFNEKVVSYLRATMTPELYSSQYDCTPISSSNQPLKLEMLQEVEKIPMESLTVKNTTVDLSQGKTNTSDETAIVTCGWTEDSDLYILDIQNGRWGSYDKVEKIYGVFWTHQPDNIGVETDAQQSYFADLLRLFEELKRKNGEKFENYDRLPIVEIKSGNKRKEDRIMNLEPLGRTAKIFVPKDAPWLFALQAQWVSFTPSGTMGLDDIIDALASQLQLYSATDQERSVNSPFKQFVKANEKKEKDLNYWRNAVFLETEDHNKQQKIDEEESEQDLWLREVQQMEEGE